jgi:hypothetical protein
MLQISLFPHSSVFVSDPKRIESISKRIIKQFGLLHLAIVDVRRYFVGDFWFGK